MNEKAHIAELLRTLDINNCKLAYQLCIACGIDPITFAKPYLIEGIIAKAEAVEYFHTYVEEDYLINSHVNLVHGTTTKSKRKRSNKQAYMNCISYRIPTLYVYYTNNIPLLSKRTFIAEKVTNLCGNIVKSENIKIDSSIIYSDYIEKPYCGETCPLEYKVMDEKFTKAIIDQYISNEDYLNFINYLTTDEI